MPAQAARGGHAGASGPQGLAIAAQRDRLIVARETRAEDGFGATACDLVKKTLKSRDGPKPNPRTRCPRTRNESRGLFAFWKDSKRTMAEPVSPYLAALRERVLVFDGAMGTSIQRYDLSPADFGGERLEGCNDYLVIAR